MKKIILFSVMAVFGCSVFAQQLNQTKPVVSADKVAVVAKVIGDKKEAADNTRVVTPIKEYKLGELINLTALSGKTQFATIALEGKKVEVTKNKITFNIKYSSYSYRFDIMTNAKGQLVLFIIPVPQQEDMLPTAEAKVTLNNGVLSLDLRAVTIDDVNSGNGWGEIYQIAKVK